MQEKLLRVLVVAPEINDPQAWWRVTYPLSQADELLLNIPTQVGWMEFARSRIMMLQRPFAPQHLAILQYAHSLGVPVVLDFDDLLWELPEGHPATKHYGPENCAMATACAREAEAVICSTPELARYVKNLGARHVVVIPNALPEYYRWSPIRNSKVVWWRGSSVHEHDILTVEDQVIEVMRRHPDWKFRACGLDWKRFRFTLKEQYEFQELMPIHEYHNKMSADSPGVMISPLMDLLFNRCKSNIGWIEAALAGSIAVCPDFDNYALPGAVRYDAAKPETFGAALEKAISATDAERASLVADARQHIDSTFRLSKVNPSRIALLQEVARGGC